MSQWLPFVLFAFVASITPGPTNILVLSNSARYGLAKAWPIILGACLGAAGLVLVVGVGLGELLFHYPRVQQAMAWCGCAWLTYLSWQLFRSAGEGIEAHSAARPLGFLGAAGLQVVNPKTWMMALAVVSVFVGEEASPVRYGLFALVFLLVAIPCLGVWACLGVGAARYVRSAAAMKRLNQGLAVLLLVATWTSLLG
ncbi:LysE family translocator [Pseudomonas sp. GD03944]|uniref:LysE family translocator n=1 Tax=Pseudomonas sp. GD03944 TaxID=2975409 RepID=UPI002448C22B|nr:LysE family translocator [Pseudomonas sp. GD03944]MDH1263443.1 LysE family translocator [Pseudomonas sp. GD03944]